MITLYNTLSRKKEAFKPLKGKTVRLYSCGPTVYNYAHIGNLRSYIFADTLKRVLLYNKYGVKHVINITDVGHLTSDADAGEDKMLLGAQRERKTVWEIAEFYTDAFKENISDLNIIPPKIWCKATDHIFQQIKMIQTLEKKGFTYTAGGNVYFDTSKLKDYGKLAGLNNIKTPSVARVERDTNKKNQHDFVLWFTKSKFQDQDMKWESPWGIGYPGWHIECSAMSAYYLKQPFDIHTGGIDHISVHHTNEIAQSEAATGKPLAHVWMHNEFLVIDSKKMAKSEGNFMTLATLKERGYDPLAYRFFCLQAHYRQQLNFTYQALDAANAGLQSLRKFILECIHRAKTHTASKTIIEPILEKVKKKFTFALNDDLGTPQAIAILFELLREVRKKEKKLTSKDYKKIHHFFLSCDDALGLNLVGISENAIPDIVTELGSLREIARKEKRWSDADSIRMRIEEAGYIVEDTPSGAKLKKK